jgi:hypothetical protein
MGYPADEWNLVPLDRWTGKSFIRAGFPEIAEKVVQIAPCGRGSVDVDAARLEARATNTA